MDVLSNVITALRRGHPHSSYTRRHAPWGERFEVSEAAGFHIALSGSCWVIPENGAPIRITAGDIVFLPRGHAHAIADSRTTQLAGSAPASLLGYRPEPPNGHPPGLETVLLCGAYQFDRNGSHPLLDQLPDVLHLPGRLGHTSALRPAVDLLAGELARPGPGADATVPALLDVLLLLILRTWLQEQRHAPNPAGWAIALDDPALFRVLSDIHSDLARPWTVQSLAGRAGMSRATLTRRFNTLLGRTPMAYLTWWRLATATRLLRTGDAPLSVIADQVGYTSEYAFANAFKREYGIAPGRYRRSTAHPVEWDTSGEPYRHTESRGLPGWRS